MCTFCPGLMQSSQVAWHRQLRAQRPPCRRRRVRTTPHVRAALCFAKVNRSSVYRLPSLQRRRLRGNPAGLSGNRDTPQRLAKRAAQRTAHERWSRKERKNRPRCAGAASWKKRSLRVLQLEEISKVRQTTSTQSCVLYGCVLHLKRVWCPVNSSKKWNRQSGAEALTHTPKLPLISGAAH